MQAQLLDLFTTAPTFENFIPIQNKAIFSALKDFSHQFTHLTGGHLCGKTHLLQSWVRSAQSHNKKAIYIEASNDDSVNFRDIGNKFDFVAIDNIEHLNGLQQILLFDLFNAIKLNNLNVFLLTSSKNSLDRIKTLREDLKTRLMSGLTLDLKALNDDEIKEAINIHISQQGIKLGEAEINFLINHCQRNIGVLVNTIHKIADSAVLENRNITIPFIKTIVNV